MRHALLIAAMAGAAGAALAAIACGSGGIEHLSDPGPDAVTDQDASSSAPPNAMGQTGPAGTGLVSGLPCDVQALLEIRCLACHSGNQPGTPELSVYSDFTAPSTSVPGKTRAEVAVLRMQSTGADRMPPPPAEAADSDEIQTMQDWIDGGTKMAAKCTDTPPAADAGSPPAVADAGADAGGLCTSGTLWANGNLKSDLMHPGVACNACHQSMGGPPLRFAGTAYRAPHDVDDCNGAKPPPTITVTVTDKNGVTLSATVNDAGNFEVRSKKGNGGNQLTPPYKAKLSDGTSTRQMMGSVTSGDCNSCHTAAGINGAPGRILAP